MQKLGLLGMKSFDQFKLLTGASSGTAKTLSISSRSSSDAITSGSFANLKLTAEKLVKEQASVRTDLDLANSKLKKSLEQIHVLEEKLQIAFNENAKLKVKQKEDEKLWQGLESKFSSTKTLCDQLTETLQFLACQVQDAEKDKLVIEEKLNTNSAALDSLNDEMKSLSLKLECAEETVRERDEALKEVTVQKQDQEAAFEGEKLKSIRLMEEKDALIKSLEEDVTTTRLAGLNLKSKLDDASMELKLKEEDLSQMRVSLENLEREKIDLQFSNDEFAKKLAASLQETQNLKEVVNTFAAKLSELDQQSLAVSDKISQLCSVYDSCSKIAVQEKHLIVQHAQKQYDLLHHQHVHIKSQKDELHVINQGLNEKVSALHSAQESVMVQHAEECRVTEERIRTLQSEVEALASQKTEAEKLAAQLEAQVANLSESLKVASNEKNELLLKLSELESEKKESAEKLLSDVQKKEEEVDGFQKDVLKLNQQVQSLETQVSKLDAAIEEKQQLIFQAMEKEKRLEDEKEEIQAQLVASECKLKEAKKQYDTMLDSKQSELSRHLKEISHRNDQAINDIRKKYDVEKQEIVNLEKEKAEKIVAEMQKMCEQRLNECKEESKQHLSCIQEEHSVLIERLRKEHEKKESNLEAEHLEELKRINRQAENDSREKMNALRDEHEVQLRALRLKHEDECRQLQQELDLQKSKEERQRALLQLQWKVMSDKPQEEQEVNSKKEYSITSKRMREPSDMKKVKHTQELPYRDVLQSPVSNLLQKVEKANSGNIMEISKHGRKVTHREYEVETTNGGTVTKRRKTKSTVSFADPKKHKKVTPPKATTPRSSIKKTRKPVYSQSNNLGDLFSEGSLNPYADGDDPYAFD
ncbi:synaptonemal complex protein 1-like [Silene latifolia]|uniref:synaptonemal complex protein 1-like n=1 Tax=Silene latifolia TaxID=37657 RepID=UPI003D77FDAF